MKNKNIFYNFYKFNYFSALLEFQQGAPLKTIWSINSLQIPSIDKFLNFIGNTHIVGKEGDTDIPPTIFRSKYEGRPFVCISIQIPDTQARGFLRILDLVIAHESISPSPIQQFISLMKEFQSHAMDIFLNEIPTYASTVAYYCSILNQKDIRLTTLNAILNEVKPILQKFGIDYTKCEKDDNIPVDHFVILTNELRDIKQLIGFDSHVTDLIDMLSKLPSAPIIKSNNYLAIGYSFPQLFNSVCTKNADKQLPQILSNNEALIHVIFSILCGRKMIIISSKNILKQSFIDLILCLSSFIPNFDESDIGFYDGAPDMTKTDEKLILCNELNEIDEIDQMSILNFNECTYIGIVCEQNSYVWSFAKMIPGQSIATYVSRCSYFINIYLGSFLATVMGFKQNRIKRSFSDMLCEKGFPKDDFPMFRYWLKLIPEFREMDKMIYSEYREKNIGTMAFGC